MHGQSHGFVPGDGLKWAGFLTDLNHQDVYGQLQGVFNLVFESSPIHDGGFALRFNQKVNIATTALVV
jgi:hypothetical protein